MDTEIQEIHQDSWIKQSNRLVEARYKLTLNEQRLIIAICSQLDRNADDFKTVRIKVNELADFCNIKAANKYTRIKNIVMRLIDRKIVLNKDDGGWYATHWLQSAEYFPKESIVEYKIDERLKPELLKLKQAYIDTQAAPLMEFTRDYTARMYFILKKMLNVKEFCYNISFFRETFCLGKSYSQFSNIKDKVIEPALAEINEKSDISIKHEYIKEGRNYTKIHFIVTEKARKKIKPVSSFPTKREKLDDESQDMLLRLINPDRWDLTEDVSRKMIKKHGLERIEKNIKYAYQYRNGKENLGGWLISCIERDEAGKQDERAAIKRKEEDQEKAKAAERLASHGKDSIALAEEETAASAEKNIEKTEGLTKFILDKIYKSVLAKEPLSAVCRMELERHGLTVDDVIAGKR